ncbi:hypothetical protein PVK06_005374 [Gossypium arboreum]|uniref:DUF4283 domain-containing protein n=1 Tax=Gossypium arboreum TaxID=29729 RepID=A0ABR0QUF2_GOSAR|nr:hypothetical protein PVK06_005374 [Gossypium arboreum]
MDELKIKLEVSKGDLEKATQFTLTGKIHASKVFNKRGVQGVKQSMWSSKHLMEVRDLGDNRYGLSFSKQGVMEATIENGPWTVMRYCLILQKWEVEKAIQEINFSKVNIWVQL